MSPPITATRGIASTRSRQHSHPSSHLISGIDHFSVGASRPNTMSRSIDLETITEEWLNGLTSPLSTAEERINILNDIEKTLVAVTDPSSSATASFLPPVNQTAAVFWALQATAGYSLAEVLLAHVYRLHRDLEHENEVCQAYELSITRSARSHSVDAQRHSSSKVHGLELEADVLSPHAGHTSPHTMPEMQRQRVHSAVSEICIAITILQGLTLCSKATKRITQRKSALELLLQIVLADYCTQLLPPILSPSTLPSTSPTFDLSHSPATPTSKTSSSPSTLASKKPSSESTDDAPLSLPSGFALDLLMCILVDSNMAQERFTDMGGIHHIVQLSHKCADAVTTPASTPVAASSPSFAQAVARSSHITALKQTDLLCLEFRYFWSQLLQQGEAVSRRSSLQGVSLSTTSSHDAAQGPAESTTPRASPRKRVSRADLRQQQRAQEQKDASGETPKATSRRSIVAPTTARATSEEAPCRHSSSRIESASASGSPRKLRHSASVAELRKKPRSLSKSDSPPPVPTLPRRTTESPMSYSQDPLAMTRRHQQSTSRPSTGDTRPPSRTERKDERVRRSTVSEAYSALSSEDAQPLGKFNASRPGMSSRDRPRIPSPLKARTPAQEVAELEDRLRRKQAVASQQAMPYRRLRSSTTNTPFEASSGGAARQSRGGESAMVAQKLDADENRNPFSDVVRVKPSLSGESGSATQFVSQRSGMSNTASSVFGSHNERTNLSSSGTAAARIPPSPAVRRAQLARARSLSPTKLSLAMVPITPPTACDL